MLSLYVVIEVNPGRSMKLRDLLGDSRTILVQEKSAAKELVMWDCLAARVVSISGRNYMTGGSSAIFTGDVERFSVLL